MFMAEVLEPRPASRDDLCLVAAIAAVAAVAAVAAAAAAAAVAV